jgi:predicted nucleic acid-binding protein
VYLLDTNVISVVAPGQVGYGPLADWLRRRSEDLFISVITVAEIENGIAKLRRQGGTTRADRLSRWLEALLHLYGSRVLKLDVEAARIAGRLLDRARSGGHAPGFADTAVAAIAAAHELTVLTRNIRHFAVFKVPAFDPFDRLPPP